MCCQVLVIVNVLPVHFNKIHTMPQFNGAAVAATVMCVCSAKNLKITSHNSIRTIYIIKRVSVFIRSLIYIAMVFTHITGTVLYNYIGLCFIYSFDAKIFFVNFRARTQKKS